MRADQLRSAAGTIAELLKKSDVLTSIRQCRDANQGGSPETSRARLTQSAKILLHGYKGFSAAEQAVCSQLHLNSIGSLDYWQALLNPEGDKTTQQAELVQLYSRAMFASSHLPSLSGLLSHTRSTPASIITNNGENSIVVRLMDAGEKASDPDRVARAIDGIDMIYSAGVNLLRRPAIDLQLREITGHPDKHLVFVGDHEGIAAMHTVLASLPDVLEEFRDYEEINLVQVVRSVPVFDDLAKLAELGAFLPAELRDIDETMYQGVTLAYESGIVVDQAPPPADPERAVQTLRRRAAPDSGIASRGFTTQQQSAAALSHDQQSPVALPATGGRMDGHNDEYYQQYLQERERLREPQHGYVEQASDTAGVNGQGRLATREYPSEPQAPVEQVQNMDAEDMPFQPGKRGGRFRR